MKLVFGSSGGGTEVNIISCSNSEYTFMQLSWADYSFFFIAQNDTILHVSTNAKKSI